MAKVKLHPYLRTAHGGLDGLVLYRRYGKIYIKKRTIPRNPRTEPQVKCRGNFGSSVKAWQNLPEEEKAIYRVRAKRKKKAGYNLFMSEYLRGIAPGSPVSPSGSSVTEDAVVASAPSDITYYTISCPENNKTGYKKDDTNTVKEGGLSAKTVLQQYEDPVKNRFNTVSTPLLTEKSTHL